MLYYFTGIQPLLTFLKEINMFELFEKPVNEQKRSKEHKKQMKNKMAEKLIYRLNFIIKDKKLDKEKLAKYLNISLYRINHLLEGSTASLTQSLIIDVCSFAKVELPYFVRSQEEEECFALFPYSSTRENNKKEKEEPVEPTPPVEEVKEEIEETVIQEPVETISFNDIQLIDKQEGLIDSILNDLRNLNEINSNLSEIYLIKYLDKHL